MPVKTQKTDPKNWQKGKNLNAQSFEQALAGKEVDRYEALKNRPGLIERYIPSQRVAARREDEIALQTGDREYVRIQLTMVRALLFFLIRKKIIMSIVRMKKGFFRLLPAVCLEKNFPSIQNNLTKHIV